MEYAFENKIFEGRGASGYQKQDKNKRKGRRQKYKCARCFVDGGSGLGLGVDLSNTGVKPRTLQRR